MTTTLQPNTEQSAYIEAVKSGANTLLTGPGGVGKSYTLDCLRTHYGRGLSVVASTGIAALNIGGVTLHSWAGLGLGTDTARHIAKRLMDKKGKAFDKIIACRRMAIDEVSMISADLLTKTDEVLRIVRRCEDPFGGIQMLFVGDFCLKVGTEILMHDGSLRRIEDVRLGEKVMGPDSTPRTVTKLFAGVAPMYEVNQANGDSYTVTENHKIALRRRRQKDRYPHLKDDIFLSPIEILQRSDKFSEVFGGYKAGCIELPEIHIDIDPYFLGVWLGDGESTGARICTPDIEIIRFCCEYAKKFGLLCNVRHERYGCPAFRVSITSGIKKRGCRNILNKLLRNYKLINNKHIPDAFLLNSVENRLQLLAGLLDTDGCWTANRFMFCSAREHLAKQVKQLADHLGFRAMLSRNSADTAWDVSIGGDTWRIPTKIERKKSCVRALGRNRLNSTLSIRAVGDGKFAGIEVDGDKLYLLADGTVTHNCQLPPIVKIDSHKWNKNESGQTDLIPRTPEELATLAGPRFAFSSPSWAAAKVGVHELRTVMRQKDLHFVSMLNKVRRGVIDDEVRQTLDARVHAEDPNPEIKPVKLNGYNKAVESINAMELQKLPGKIETYAAEDSGIPAFIDMIKRNCIAPEFLNLKVDAQVMLLRNLDTENGLVNGAIGIVRDFAADGLPLVEFAGENIIKCEPKTWEYSSDGQVLASRTQVPLRLAWAWSIHKSQSQTMDKVEVDLTSVFEAGQAYVALSRCRTLEGLFLTGVDYEKIFADQQALAFYGYK